jgi:hypothetical protein
MERRKQDYRNDVTRWCEKPHPAHAWSKPTECKNGAEQKLSALASYSACGDSRKYGNANKCKRPPTPWREAECN